MFNCRKILTRKVNKKNSSILFFMGLCHIGNSFAADLPNAEDPCSVAIPRSAHKIEESEFARHGIFSINFDERLTEIGANAFLRCQNLTGTIVIPKNVTKIGAKAFADTKIEKLVLDTENLDTIGEYAFENCTKLRSVTLKNVKKIGANSFGNTRALRYIAIPGCVTEIGESAFYRSSLRNVTIEKGLTIIGPSAFEACADLHTINIPDTVIYIGNYAFSLCENLKQITIPENVSIIGTHAFCMTPLRHLKIHYNALQKLIFSSETAFSNCGSLNTVTVYGCSEYANQLDDLKGYLKESLMNIGINENVTIEVINNVR